MDLDTQNRLIGACAWQVNRRRPNGGCAASSAALKLAPLDAPVSSESVS